MIENLKARHPNINRTLHFAASSRMYQEIERNPLELESELVRSLF
jgi:hypothetical protein